MKRVALLRLLAGVSLSTGGAAAAPSRLARKVQRIERACNLPKGTITAIADEVHFAPSPNEKYENIDCALGLLKRGGVEKMGFIGNEADPNAALDEPYEYVVEGSAVQITALASAAQSEGWIIVKSARADDGTTFVVFKTHPGETSGGADHLMQRIWKREFGDILLSRAPQPLIEPNTAAD